jgi:nucleotide-binding universal stress UspA family protein
MLEKLLLPLDGSELGEIALVYARDLAVALGSEIQMLYSVERPDREYRRMCEIYLDKVAERLVTQLKQGGSDADVKTIVVDGEPSETIIKYAGEHNSHLIILASHGRSGIMPWVMGSTASKIIQRSSIPVLLVRATTIKNQRQMRVFSKILLPLDGSAMGEAALPYVIEIARVLECEVTLLRVVELGEHVHSIGGPDYFKFSEQQVETEKIEVLRYLDEIKKRFTGSRGTVRCELKIGDAAQEILKLAREDDVRVIAMSSHGKSGVMKWVMGSVSNKIMNAGKVPLLLVRPPQGKKGN